MLGNLGTVSNIRSMIISKLIFTKRGYHFRRVKHLRPEGIFQVITDDEVVGKNFFIFCDKKEIEKVGEFFEYIEKKRVQWLRDKKITGLLK